MKTYRVQISNGREIQSDQKVSVRLMVTKQSHVHRDFLITLYDLINFCNYVSIYSTSNSERFSCILCYLIACGVYMEFGICLVQPEDASHYGNRLRI